MFSTYSAGQLQKWESFVPRSSKTLAVRFSGALPRATPHPTHSLLFPIALRWRCGKRILLQRCTDRDTAQNVTEKNLVSLGLSVLGLHGFAQSWGCGG